MSQNPPGGADGPDPSSPLTPPPGQSGMPVTEGDEPPRRRAWVVPVVLIAVVVIFAALAAYLFLRDREPAPQATPTVTATPSATPTPDRRTVSTDPLEPRLDTSVANTSYKLTAEGWAADPDAVAAGAREAFKGTYSDGTTDVAVTAAAFDTLQGQDTYSEQLAGKLASGGAALQGEGSVYANNTGHYWYFVQGDGKSTTIVWRTDDGVVLSLTGPADAVQAVYRNMLI